MKTLIILLLFFSTTVSADYLFLDWVNATTRTDGSPMTYDNPTHTSLRYKLPGGVLTDFVLSPGSPELFNQHKQTKLRYKVAGGAWTYLVLDATTTTSAVISVPAGSYTVQARHFDVFGFKSANAVVTKTAVVCDVGNLPLPPPPSIGPADPNSPITTAPPSVVPGDPNSPPIGDGRIRPLDPLCGRLDTELVY